MATVGLNFGSATSGAGFDVAATVTSILSIESAIETPWKTQLTSLQAQDAALSGLGTNLSALSTAVSALTNFDGVLASKRGSSSDQSVLTLSIATSTAVAGSHTVVVRSLAQTSSQYSDEIANGSDTLSGSLSFQIGAGPAHSITLDSTNNTLQTLATAINSGSYGVTASIVSDPQGARLSVVSNTSGAGGQIALTPQLTDSTTSTSIGFKSGQVGLDAQLNVDGLDTSSASNTVTGAIPGVTFQLLSASPTKSLQVQISNDNSLVESAMQSVVTAYNAVAASLRVQEGKDATGKAEPLFGNPTLALLQNQLAGALMKGAASGSISSITQLGVSLKTDGTLAFDVNALDSKLNTSFSEVTGYFQNPGSFGQSFASALNSLGTASPTGAVTLALAQNSSQEAAINSNIATTDSRVAEEKIRLTQQLTAANQILQSIPQLLSAQNQIYNAITGYKGG
jgi:flagellar hook-associated protein 2